MLKQITSCLLFFTAFNGLAQVQPDYNAESIPATLKIRATAVIRNMETTVDMRSHENVILTVKKAVTILNQNGDEHAALSIYYDKNRVIKNVKGMILDAYGKQTGKFSLSNFTDKSAVSSFSLFEDSRIKSFSPGAVSYPYTIVYEYEIRNKQNLIIPDWYANPYSDQAVETSSYTFISKTEDQLRIKAYNYKGNPEVTESEKTTTRTWRANNLTASKREPYAPNPKQYLTYVKIAPQQFNYYGYKGSYQNWDELGKWVYDNLIKTRQDLSPETIREAQELVKGIENDKDKARKIYEYVQKKTRYISVQIGIGGFQPFAASEVDRLGYGDCKALVNYTQSLLKAVNINSLYCVVNSGNLKEDMIPDFAGMEQGDHIILCVPLKNDTTWLECTSQDAPFGYLGSFTDDRTVFACSPEGGKLLKTPVLSTAANLLKRKATLTLSKDGNIAGQLKTDFSGAQYENYESLAHKPYTEQLKLLKKEYDIDNINFSDFKLVQKKDDNPVTSEALNVTIEKYAPAAGSRIYLIPNAFNKTRALPEVRNRTLPVYVNRGYTDEDELTYHLPDGYMIEAKPENRLISTPFGSYSIAITFSGNKLVYHRKMVLNAGTYTAAQYADFASFMNSVNTSDNGKVIFKID